jgi:hypothetical protein
MLGENGPFSKIHNAPVINTSAPVIDTEMTTIERLTIPSPAHDEAAG